MGRKALWTFLLGKKMAEKVKKTKLKLVDNEGKEAKVVKKGKGRKATISRFHITVNSQKIEEIYRGKIKECLTGMHEALSELIKCVDTDDLKHYPQATDTKEEAQARHDSFLKLIDEVDMEAVIERGGKYHKWHSHIMVSIKHHTRVQMDQAKLRVCWRDGLDVSDVHLSIRYVSGVEVVYDYLKKTISLEK